MVWMDPLEPLIVHEAKLQLHQRQRRIWWRVAAIEHNSTAIAALAVIRSLSGNICVETVLWRSSGYAHERLSIPDVELHVAPLDLAMQQQAENSCDLIVAQHGVWKIRSNAIHCKVACYDSLLVTLEKGIVAPPSITEAIIASNADHLQEEGMISLIMAENGLATNLKASSRSDASSVDEATDFIAGRHFSCRHSNPMAGYRPRRLPFWQRAHDVASGWLRSQPKDFVVVTVGTHLLRDISSAGIAANQTIAMVADDLVGLDYAWRRMLRAGLQLHGFQEHFQRSDAFYVCNRDRLSFARYLNGKKIVVVILLASVEDAEYATSLLQAAAIGSILVAIAFSRSLLQFLPNSRYTAIESGYQVEVIDGIICETEEGLSRWHATSESIHRMCADIPLRNNSLLRMDHSGLESTSKQMLTENENICKLLNVAIYVRHQITLQ